MLTSSHDRRRTSGSRRADGGGQEARASGRGSGRTGAPRVEPTITSGPARSPSSSRSGRAPRLPRDSGGTCGARASTGGPPDPGGGQDAGRLGDRHQGGGGRVPVEAPAGAAEPEPVAGRVHARRRDGPRPGNGEGGRIRSHCRDDREVPKRRRRSGGRTLVPVRERMGPAAAQGPAFGPARAHDRPARHEPWSHGGGAGEPVL